MEQNTQTKKCYLYVLNTLSDWEIGYITAELNSNRFLLKNIKYELITVGNNLNPIKTMGGISITPDKAINDVQFKAGDLLILPGADTWLEDSNKDVLSILPDLLKKDIIIAAICGATIALAQTGLLDNKKHTSNDKSLLTMMCPQYKGSSLYIEEPVAVDENLITASGLAPLEFTYEILKKTKAMKESTLEAWYKLYQTREPQYFFSLMESLK